MSNRQRFIFCCLLLFSLNSCATLKEIVQEPTVTFKEIVPQDLSLTEGTFRFNFNVNNPNPLGLNLSKITYDLQLNQKEFVKNSLEESIKVPAKGDTVMSIPVTVRYADLFSSLSDALKSDTVAYALKGEVGIGPFSIPYQQQGSLKMPKLPEIAIENIDVGKLSLDGAAMKLKLKLKNPNDFNINFNGLNYAVKLQGKEFASGLAKNLAPIGAKSENLLDLDLNISFKELGRSALAILKGAGTQYEIKGDFLLNQPGQAEKRIPFLKSGELPLQ